MNPRSLTFPDEIEATNDVKDVLLQLLNKDPDKRANFAELKLHPWVTADLPDARAWIESTDPSLLDAVTVSEAEMSKAFTFLVRFYDLLFSYVDIFAF